MKEICGSENVSSHQDFSFFLIFFFVFVIVIYDLLYFIITNQKLKMLFSLIGAGHSQKQQQQQATKEGVKGSN